MVVESHNLTALIIGSLRLPIAVTIARGYSIALQ